VSDRPLPNSPRSRQAAKRLQRRRKRLARHFLDKAYTEYLREAPRNNNNNNNNNHFNSSISVPSPPPLPLPQLPSPNQVPSVPRSPTSPFVEPDSSHSSLIQRIFPDSPPPSIHSFSLPSYSPIHSPEESLRPSSPANSTASSVKFIDELHIPPSQPRHYYHYDPHQFLNTLIFQFPQRTTPLPSGSNSIGPDDFDLFEIRTTQVRTQIQLFLSFFPFPPSLMKFLSASFTIFSLPRQPLSVKLTNRLTTLYFLSVFPLLCNNHILTYTIHIQTDTINCRNQSTLTLYQLYS